MVFFPRVSRSEPSKENSVITSETLRSCFGLDFPGESRERAADWSANSVDVAFRLRQVFSVALTDPMVVWAVLSTAALSMTAVDLLPCDSLVLGQSLRRLFKVIWCPLWPLRMRRCSGEVTPSSGTSSMPKRCTRQAFRSGLVGSSVLLVAIEICAASKISRHRQVGPNALLHGRPELVSPLQVVDGFFESLRPRLHNILQITSASFAAVTTEETGQAWRARGESRPRQAKCLPQPHSPATAPRLDSLSHSRQDTKARAQV
ncbi:hypothetical protein KC328_g66 [Hortaea werneckii]|nr:hypothetical protein KC328_g66 [Hortaea werneckii]